MPTVTALASTERSICFAIPQINLLCRQTSATRTINARPPPSYRLHNSSFIPVHSRRVQFRPQTSSPNRTPIMGSLFSTAIRSFPIITGAALVTLGQVLSSFVSFKFPKVVPLELADVISLALSLALSTLYYAHSAFSLRQKLLLFGVSSWAIRLSTFLTSRFRAGFHDVRLDNFRGSIKGAKAWCLAQTTWISVILLPVWVGMSSTPQSALNVLDILSFITAMTGLALTTLADFQKASFLRDNASRPASLRMPYCDVGLFRFSRFANYFGDWLLWTSLSFLAFQTDGTLLRFLLPICPWFVLQIFYKLCMPLAYKSVRKRATDEQFADWLRISAFIPKMPSK